jgi:hypothetical protein
MRLDELEWGCREADGAYTAFKTMFLGRNGRPNTIMRNHDGTYTIWKDVAPGAGQGSARWFDLDPLTAQCLLIELTKENTKDE